MQKENRNVQNNDALKGFLFRAYNARCYKNVGQVLPDKKQNLIKNNSCEAVTVLQPYGAGSEQQLLRTSVSLNNTPSSALTGHLPPHGEAAHFNAPSTWRERVKARMRGCSLFNLINPSPALRASSPARGEEDVVRGFTLIELLVVILIIGILAAVALPQYQRAVAKSQFATLKNLVKSIAVSQEVYYLDNGEYTTDFDDLILQLPADGELNETKDIITFDWGKCQITTTITACKNDKAFLSYQQYYKHVTFSKGQTKCLSWNDLAAQICLQETGDKSPKSYSNSGNPYKVYIYQ